MVYRRTEGEPIFGGARASTSDGLKGLLAKVIARVMKMFNRLGHLVVDAPAHLLQAAKVRLWLAVPVPDHSTFSRIRHGRFRDSHALRWVFDAVLGRIWSRG